MTALEVPTFVPSPRPPSPFCRSAAANPEAAAAYFRLHQGRTGSVQPRGPALLLDHQYSHSHGDHAQRERDQFSVIVGARRSLLKNEDPFRHNVGPLSDSYQNAEALDQVEKQNMFIFP
jgi:hypothetical protein